MYFSGTKCCLLAFCCVVSFSLAAKDVKTAAVGSGLKKPVCFVENKGQLADQDNEARNDIQFRLSTPGMSLFVGNGQLHYQFRKNEGRAADSKVDVYRMDVTLLGADQAATVSALEPQGYYENYYLSQTTADGFTAHSYNRIVYKNVYPSIDWVLYVKDNNVEYDFVVRPGGNVNDIKLKYGGATSLKIAKDGSLSAQTPMGSVQEKRPYAYETATGKAVASGFRLHNNIVCFETGGYNGSLTIDPSISWSTYWGGAGEEVATGISAAQSPGLFTYVCGFATTPGLATAGAFQTAFGAGTMDAYLAKYSTAGVVQFITYFGGTGISKGMGVSLEIGAANVYMAGVTSSAGAGLTTGGAYHGTNNGANDGFLIKFNNAGARQWCTFYGGPGNDIINGVAVDASNNVYITGQTASTTLISSGGAYQAAISGASDAFLAKFNSGGTNQWSTYYGGTAEEQGMGIVCDALGNVDITGQTNSVISIASAGAYQGALSGTQNAFIAQFNSGGTRNWGTYFGGTSTEIGNGIASDASGNIAVVGNTTSGSGIASAHAFQPSFGGVQDAFVAYLANTGALKWSSYYGGTATDYGQAVCFDLHGNAVIAGGTFSTSGIATANSLQPAIGGNYDAFLSKINPLGQTLWNTYFGGAFYDYANAVGCDQSDQLTLAGYTTSVGNYGAGGISTVGSAQAANGGGTYDAFVTKFKVDTMVAIAQPFTDTLVCAGGALNVAYTVPAPVAGFQTGNVFTVQLSTATGSFTGATNIGTVTATGSGTVACTIPAAASGTGYRIRVVASNPAFTSPDDFLDISVVASIAPSTAASNSPVCALGTLDLYDSAPYSLSAWSWTGPAGFVSAVQNPVVSGVSIAYTGIYSVTATHNGCPSDVATVSVIVNSATPPTPSVGVSAVCAGDTLFLTANSDTSATVSWNWSGPGSYTSTMQNPYITPATVADAGNYYVNDIMEGCPSALQVDAVVVNATTPVTASISASPGYTNRGAGDTVCLGTMVNFMASSINGGSTPTYQWYAGGMPVVGAITNAWSSGTLTNGEVVYCAVSSSELCPSPVHAPSNSIKMNMIDNSPIVYISASPAAHVAPGSSITFISTVYNGGTNPVYVWFKNGAVIPGANDSAYTLTGVNAPDTITLQVTSTMQCPVPDSTATSNMIIAESNVGVTQVSALLQDIAIFPNPNGGAFAIRGTVVNTDPVAYSVTNLIGQVVATGTLLPNNYQLEKTIGIGDISDGIYLIQFVQDGQGKIIRFVVQKQ